ncbi:protein lin-9 homolog [Macrosteles quadrilineatus]|uniref:protein lin-9 homolog n=1 Tax=Macrosteles quadrilineatus TaxID=74068 RepID=UPI0023E0CB07|nr:protein lin-9 homolog [Macrosteles quadrilineatus]
MADELENESAQALLAFKNGGIKFDPGPEIKMESEDVLGPLGLLRVGTELPPRSPQPGLILNRRGMPQRVRKKNRLFFDDDVVNITTPKTKRSTGKSPAKKPPSAGKVIRTIKSEESPIKQDSPDRRLGQKIGMRLRNLLKLPKAHKWVCYEWFYSNIDKALFGGDNDFMVCLKENFPQLKTRCLSRVEWCKLRRIMGKPRRCSQAFFTEERRELENKRTKIRLVQQRKIGDISHCKDLPNEIPLQLVIGSKVTARLRRPQDGLFTGSIDAVDTSNNTYRITFERPGLGTHSVPDYEVLSHEPPDTMPMSSLSALFRPRLSSASTPSVPSRIPPSLPSAGPDPMLSAVSSKPKADTPIGSAFPQNALEMIVRLSKILDIKKIKVKHLQDFNTEAERMKSFGDPITEDFQKRYANKVIELEHLNVHLKEILASVQKHCHELAPEAALAAMLMPGQIQELSHLEAKQMVMRYNTSIKDDGVIDLITSLTSLMLQVKNLSESERSSYEVDILNTSMEQIKTKLNPANRSVFENCVEVHMRHIQLGLTGPLSFSL